MSRWFRLYDELLDDPKVQRLSGDDFKGWVNLLCLMCRGSANLSGENDIAFALRIDVRKAKAMLGRLVEAGLLIKSEEGFKPHKWDERQYKSDVSTDRVKRFRERSKTATETPPDTDTETDTDSSVAKATGTVVPLIDPEKAAFDAGIRLLAGAGVSETRARPMLGKWKRDHGAASVIEALGAAQREAAIDPISFIEGRWRQQAKGRAEAWDSPC